MYRTSAHGDHDPGFNVQKWLWLLIAALLLGVYLTTQFSLRGLVPGDLNVLVLQPLLWLMVALISFVLWRYGIGERPRPSLEILTLALVLGVFQVAAWLLSGLAFGFGRSPHGTELPVMLGNALFAGSTLVGMEMARVTIVGSLRRRNAAVGLAAASILLTAISIPFGQYMAVSDVPSVLRFGGKVLLPTISQNLLTSILALVGGPVPALLYRGLIVAFEWFFPLHPDLQMIVAAFVGTMPAALGMLALEKELGPSIEEGVELGGRSKQIPGSWITAGAISVTLLFFNIGAFGYRPTLVVGPSMEPTFGTGDVVITRPVEPSSLEEGDVVRFRTEVGAIVHRVVEVRRDEGGLRIITRGDGNNTDDAPILPEQIEGEMVLLVPSVGWPAVLLRQGLALLR